MHAEHVFDPEALGERARMVSFSVHCEKPVPKDVDMYYVRVFASIFRVRTAVLSGPGSS